MLLYVRSIYLPLLTLFTVPLGAEGNLGLLKDKRLNMLLSCHQSAKNIYTPIFHNARLFLVNTAI